MTIDVIRPACFLKKNIFKTGTQNNLIPLRVSLCSLDQPKTLYVAQGDFKLPDSNSLDLVSRVS